MKTLILTLIAIISFTIGTSAKDPAYVKIRLGQSKTADGGKVSIKFLSVVEDSRCPANAKCVWEGNAKIKLVVLRGKGNSKTIEVNSSLQPRSVIIYGYAIKFSDLSPYPGIGRKDGVQVATISVEKAH